MTKVYVGPSIPYSVLRKSQILNGTQEQIDAFVGSLYEKYPEIKYLIVDIADLTDMQTKIKTKGNIYYKYYKDIEARAYVSRKGY